jgi:cation:H+ antiporter
MSKRESLQVESEYSGSIPAQRRPLLDIIMIVLGIIGLQFGAGMIVDAAVALAEALGVSKRVVGLTIVAIGTSLPELATAAVAARQRKSDIAIGNIIGSNLFNVLAVIGVSSALHPIPTDHLTMVRDGPIMLGAAVLLWPILRTGSVVRRREGAVLVALYTAYLTWVVVAR